MARSGSQPISAAVCLIAVLFCVGNADSSQLRQLQAIPCSPGTYTGSDGSCVPCKEGFYSADGTARECKPCPAVKLAECAKRSYCDPKKGLVIEWWPVGHICSNGKSFCNEEHFCVQEPQGAGCPAGTGGPSCHPCKMGFWSNGTASADGVVRCKKCPTHRIACRKMMTPCEMLPPCNMTNGEQTSSCYVSKPDGASCKIWRSTGPDAGFNAPGFCVQGQCIERDACLPGTGGPKCLPCKPYTWSPGLPRGTPCKRCRKATCNCLPHPCQQIPPCNATSGTSNKSTCFVDKPDGAKCNPRKRFESHSRSGTTASGFNGGNFAVTKAGVAAGCRLYDPPTVIRQVPYTCQKGGCLPSN